MAAPIGAEVGLYYDADVSVSEDDFIQTPTGRTYLVTRVRVQARGIYAGIRHHLRAIVVPAETVQSDDKVHPIQWYKRG